MNLSDLLDRQRRKNPNQIEPDTIAMNALTTLLTTSRGWLVRQIVKGTAYITGPLAIWLEAQGQGEHAGAIVAGIVAVVSALAEIGLSYVARKNP
jgi:butyrate kinase